MSKLKELRKKAGLTQQELAEKSGVSYSLVCKLESGERNIKFAGVANIGKLCNALGCRVRDIVTDPEFLIWLEDTPYAKRTLQLELARVEREAAMEAIKERMQRLQDERNGIKEEPKPIVERTTEKIRKTFTIEVEFPADFIPPDDFDEANWDNNFHGKCYECPFYVFTDDNGDWCNYIDCSDHEGCPIKKYFE